MTVENSEIGSGAQQAHAFVRLAHPRSRMQYRRHRNDADEVYVEGSPEHHPHARNLRELGTGLGSQTYGAGVGSRARVHYAASELARPIEPKHSCPQAALITERPVRCACFVLSQFKQTHAISPNVQAMCRRIKLHFRKVDIHPPTKNSPTSIVEIVINSL